MNIKIKELLQTVTNFKSSIDTGKYLFNWFKTNVKFRYSKQTKISNGRFNYELYGSLNPKIIFFCHLDTTTPQLAQKNVVKGDKFYGLGAKDMKGGIVALQNILTDVDTNGVGIVFYDGEESDQAGIKKILLTWRKKPMLIICPESRFNIGHTSRGLLTFEINIHGKSVHSARYWQGKNSIDGVYSYIEYINSNINKYTNNIFGTPKVTCLWIKSGESYSGEGVIPKTCNAVFEIRTTNIKLNFKLIKKLSRMFAKKKGYRLLLNLIDSYPCTNIPKKNVLILVNSIRKNKFSIHFTDPKVSGFNDVFLLWHKNKTPVVNFGPYGEGNHTSDEWVSLSSIEKTSKVYKTLIESL